LTPYDFLYEIGDKDEPIRVGARARSLDEVPVVLCRKAQQKSTFRPVTLFMDRVEETIDSLRRNYELVGDITLVFMGRVVPSTETQGG
jgi:hypothetical protein